MTQSEELGDSSQDAHDGQFEGVGGLAGQFA